MSSFGNISFGTPRRKLVQGNLVVTSTSQSAVFNPATKSDSFPSVGQSAESSHGSFPQRAQRSIYGFSPEKQKPLSELDLSDDAQPDITERAAAEQAKQETKNIIVVDALTQRLADDVAEVSVTERVEPSPCKVICHTPRAAKLSLSNTGDTHRAANVSVDLLHSVIIKDSIAEQPDTVHPEQRAMQSGSFSSQSSSLSSSAAELGMEVPSSLKDISNELERTRCEPPHSPESKPEKSLKSKPAVKEKQQVKKKTGRVVASRLMNTTAAHRAKTVGQSRHEPHQSLRHSSTSNKTKNLNEPSSIKKVTSAKQSTLKATKETPQKHTSNTERPASTPEFVAPNESFDVSALPGSRTFNRVLNETVSFCVPSEPAPSVRPKTASKGSVKKPKSAAGKSSKSTDVTQGSLDVGYARYLQWLFLSSKADSSIKSEEAEVMSELQNVWTENQKMKLKLSSLEQEYDRIQHVTDLDEILDLQKSLLGPIVHELPLLNQSYQSMALALDTTRHELKTEGIHIPDTKREQEEFEGSLMSVLDESEQLLSDITAHTRRETSTTSQYAQAIDSLSRTVADEGKEINRCKVLVKAAQTLANHENSLKIQEIEFSQL